MCQETIQATGEREDTTQLTKLTRVRRIGGGRLIQADQGHTGEITNTLATKSNNETVVITTYPFHCAVIDFEPI